MLAESILTNDGSFDLAASIAKTSYVGQFQNLTISLETLFVTRELDLRSRGMQNCSKPALILDLYRIYSGYIDLRFVNPVSIQNFYNTNAGDWFKHYNTPTLTTSLWHHISTSEKGILKGLFPEKLIECSELLNNNPNYYLDLLTTNLKNEFMERI